ncbi:MAG: hypothetical protein GEU83_01430 [Pseudonocardiaceae bacterium]|nr:hypothetical protein [Pseudonocardiaceae bacterium]
MAGTVALMFGASASFGAASAAAATGTECGGTVRGEPGESVSVNPRSLLGTGPSSLMTVGQIPSSGTSTINVTSALGGVLGPLAPACTLTLEAVEQVTEPVTKAAEPVVEAAEGVTGPLPGSSEPQPERPAPGSNGPTAESNGPAANRPVPAPAPQLGPFMPANFDVGPMQQGVYDFSSLSLYDYGQLFSANAGEFGSLPNSNLFGGSDLFGQSPRFGILGSDRGGAAEDVAAAGRAEALPAQGADRVALPVLVAVLMLAGVTAALVRSWVVRPSKG